MQVAHSCALADSDGMAIPLFILKVSLYKFGCAGISSTIDRTVDGFERAKYGALHALVYVDARSTILAI